MLPLSSASVASQSADILPFPLLSVYLYFLGFFYHRWRPYPNEFCSVAYHHAAVVDLFAILLTPDFAFALDRHFIGKIIFLVLFIIKRMMQYYYPCNVRVGL